MFRAHIGAQFSILIIPHFALFCKCRAKADFGPFTFGIGFAGCSIAQAGDVAVINVRHRVRGLFTSPAARERTSPQT